MNPSSLSSEFERQILEEALGAPEVALMRLSIEIDRQFRILLASVGQLGKYGGTNPSEALDLLSASSTGEAIPSELRETLKSFWEIRNAIIHRSRGVNQPLSIRALDYGLRILRMLMSIPRPSYVVRYTDIELFADGQCTRMRSDVRGVILESFGPSGQSFGQHIHPSTKSYEVGDKVTWEWDLSGEGWGETWYRRPSDGKPELAWSGSLEFIGRKLDAI